MLFASGLILERDPLEVSDLPAAFAAWLRDAGSLAAIAIVVWGLAYLVRRPAWARGGWTARSTASVTLVALSAALYAFFLALVLTQGVRTVRPAAVNPNLVPDAEVVYSPLQNVVMTAAGGLALAAVLLPILFDLGTRIRMRRIWALARLSLKEAWSKGVVWVALIIPLIYLYADWYMTPALPKDQLQQRVKVVYFALTLLIVVTALLLGSFNIPTDVRNQTIHTIVTKPVERYEIVLGRFLGYALLLLAEVGVLSALSLFYAERGLHPEAAEESHRARVPLLAKQLDFYNTKGESVGREWAYRKYFGNLEAQPGANTQYALWYFSRLPASVAEADRKDVRVEFSFDIFRTTKGDERGGGGVECTFVFAPGGLTVGEVETEVKKLEKEHTQTQKPASLAELATKYGVWVARKVRVTDYHTGVLDVPAGLFRKLYEEQGKEGDAKAREGPAPALQVLVSMDRSSGPQMLGVARRDLYILAAERPFGLNFLKGSLGLWFVSLLVLGIALACSTYLSGVISLLATAFLCGAGLFVDYIKSIAFGTTSGGGPAEALYRLTQRQGPVVQLDRGSAAVEVVRFVDMVYRWLLRRVLSIIPDVSRFDLTTYVASGFDVSWGQVLFADSFVPLLGYLIPCGILAYYLMNSREIANPT